MPDVGYYITRLQELPPGTAAKKATMKMLRAVENELKKIVAQILPAHISDRELLQSLEGFSCMEDVLHALRRERPPFFIQPSARRQLVPLIQLQFPHHVVEIVEEAKIVCCHVFDLLGSGPVNLDEFSIEHEGRENCTYLPWHYDFKTGYRWSPTKFYKEIEIPYGKADIKVPWELSRFQHAAALGQAYWLTNEEKYAQEFVQQVDDWIDRNPPRFGVNWSCTMDVAIRVANWIMGFYFFKDSEAITDEFLAKFLKSLLTHGRHIMANLENGDIANNHYLSDLVGLIYLGMTFPEFLEARIWREYGIRELVKEMDKQVYDDGMDFEDSTCYQRLALELFFYPTLLCKLNGIDLPQQYVDKLKKMFDFVLYVLKPNGRMPQIGDNDNGRLHVFGKRDILDMTYLLTFAAIYCDSDAYKMHEFGFASEALWIFGPKAWECWCKLPGRSVEELGSRAFRDGGIYVMRYKKDYMVISCGSREQNGFGGHAHNDRLGFELCVDGEDIIVDPGSGNYTSNPNLRNHFRSASAHSSPRFLIDSPNSNNIWNLFRNRDIPTTKVAKWQVSEYQVILAAKKIEKTGPNANHVVIYEHFSYMPQERVFSVIFRCSNQSDRPIVLGLTLPPGLRPQTDIEGAITICMPNGTSRALLSTMREGGSPSIRVKSALYSDRYGSVQGTYSVEYSWESSKPYCGMIILAGCNANKRANLRVLEVLLNREMNYGDRLDSQ